MANGEWRGDYGSVVITSYRDLEVWQKSVPLAEACYRLTALFPSAETYGMVSQIRRSSGSVAANIAEGHGRENTGSFVQFLRHSQGSLKELETHLLIAERVKLAHTDAIGPMLGDCEVVWKQLRALIRSLQKRIDNMDR